VVAALVCFFPLSLTEACNKKTQAAPNVTLTLIDQSWVDKESQARLREELHLFTKQTGIQVQILPAPEAAAEQLET
jgi:hypothetical protein